MVSAALGAAARMVRRTFESSTCTFTGKESIYASTSLGFMTSSQSPCDDFFHDFVGAAIDALHARVREQTAYQVFVHVPITAVQLHALIEHLLLHVAAPPLGHGRGLRIQLARDEIHY